MRKPSSGHRTNRAGILVVSLLLGAAGEQASAQDCGLKKMATLDMVKTNSGALAVDVSLNGQTERLQVDLNGMYSGITADEAARLGLQSRRIENGVHMVTNNGTPIDHYAMVDKIAIGANSGTHVPFEIQPGTKTQDGVAGDLAADLLRNFDVDLDFGANRVNLFSPDHCPGKVVYWGANYVSIPLTVQSDGRAFIPVTLDGHDVMATITTAAYPTLLDSVIADRAFGVNGRTPGIELAKDAQPDDVVRFRYRFKSLSFNGVEVRNPLIAIFDSNAAETALRRAASRMELDPATVGGSSIELTRLIIGLDIVSKLHLYVAYREKTIYLTGAGAGQAAAPH